jgi:hypothetical protein
MALASGSMLTSLYGPDFSRYILMCISTALSHTVMVYIIYETEFEISKLCHCTFITYSHALGWFFLLWVGLLGPGVIARYVIGKWERANLVIAMGRFYK